MTEAVLARVRRKIATKATVDDHGCWIQVDEIRQKHERGFPPGWLAEDYGLSAGYVRALVR